LHAAEYSAEAARRDDHGRVPHRRVDRASGLQAAVYVTRDDLGWRSRAGLGAPPASRGDPAELRIANCIWSSGAI
jgi:hypothetical protein